MDGTSDAEPLDLCVIGAGPHALSLLTRLVDDEPDLLTEAVAEAVKQAAAGIAKL